VCISNDHWAHHVSQSLFGDALDDEIGQEDSARQRHAQRELPGLQPRRTRPSSALWHDMCQVNCCSLKLLHRLSLNACVRSRSGGEADARDTTASVRMIVHVVVRGDELQS
jgi:hypothetical protein